MTKYECDRCGKDVTNPQKIIVTQQVRRVEVSMGFTKVHWPRATKELDLCDDCHKATLVFLKVEVDEEPGQEEGMFRCKPKSGETMEEFKDHVWRMKEHLRKLP